MNSRNQSLDVLRGVKQMRAVALLLFLLVLHIFVGDSFARVAGVLALGIWMAFDPLDDRRVKLFLCSTLLLVVVSGVGVLLAVLHPPSPLRYDLYLHAIDHGLGFCVPEYLFRFLSSAPWLAKLTVALYQMLPTMMIAGYGWALYSSSASNSLLVCYLISSLCGALYWIVPAAGPGFLLGPALKFSHSTPQLALISLPFAANCIPSMHLSSAVCAWYFSRKHNIGSKITLAYVFITVFSTLAMGEHYVIDLVVGLPFALFVISAAKREYLQAIISFAVTLGWLLGIRLAVHPLVKHNVLTWTTAAITASAAILFLARSEQRTMRWCPTFISELFRIREQIPTLGFQKTL